MPATSKTAICRQALSMIGINTPLGDVDNEFTAQANACRLFFDQVRDIVLETRPWPFATRRWALQDIGTTGTLWTDWAYRYKKPADCILAVRIVNPYGRAINLLHDPFSSSALLMKKPPFRIVDQETEYGDAILCDLNDATLEGNFRVTDPNRFSNSANHAIAMGVAAHVAYPLRVSADIASKAETMFSNWLAEAANLAMREQTDDPEAPSEYQSARA